MSKSHITCAALMCTLVSSGHAVVLASTNFDSASKSAASQTMTGIVWTGDDPASVSAGSEVTTLGSANAGYFITGFGATGFAPDQNIENEGPWTATFELTVGGASAVTLTSISFDYAALNNGGATQGANFRAQNFDILVNGSVFDSQKQTTLVNGDLTFTDSIGLNAGVNSIAITSSEVNGPGYNMGIDNLTFNGDIAAVPEPTTMGLLGLGLLALTRRRRP